MESHQKPKPQEYATEAQIQFFDRLRSGDDPVHEHARTKLVKLAEETLHLLNDLSVRKADHDPEVRRILAMLKTLAGYEAERFYLEIVTSGYDVSEPSVLDDLSEKAKARFTEDEKTVIALCEMDDVDLDEAYREDDERVYRFSTTDPVIVEKYGFQSQDEIDAEYEAWAKRLTPVSVASVEEIEDPDVKAAALAVAESKGAATAIAIYRAVVGVVGKDDKAKQIELLRKAVSA